MTSNRKQILAAAAVTSINIAVAVTVNLLTSGWSWLVFLVLAVLSGAWVGLEAWRAAPRRPSRALLGSPAKPNVLGSFVPRPELAGAIVRALLAGRARKVAITTALTGAGGFGKTTLAEDVCRRPEIRAAFVLVLWVPVGQELRGAALADAINDVSERVDGQRPGLTSPEQAALRLGELLQKRGRCLLVVDDVWTTEQLRPFLNIGRGCTLLVTTRFPELLPDDSDTIEVDQMSRTQARDLVTGGLTLPPALSDQLLDITGRWPLALGLANGVLRRAARDGADVTEAAERLLARLRDRGPAALDVTDAARRNRTVAATLESSFSLLSDRRDRVVELGIFPEDTETPVSLVILLWQTTAGLSRDESEQLCRELADLSLVIQPAGEPSLRLHDVIRAYLRYECGAERIRELHGVLLDAIAAELPEPEQRPKRWWLLPDASESLWRTLSYHLTGAGREAEVAALVTKPHWVIRKLRKLGPVAVAEDLALVDTGIAKELSGFLDRLGHLLTPTVPEHAVVNALAQRLPDTPAFTELRQAAEAEVATVPRLVAYPDLPDLPDPALNRVLEGHERGVDACAFAPDGKWLVSASDDGLRVWDVEHGQLIRQVAGSDHGYFSGLALSPSGRLLAAEGADDKTVQVWETVGWRTIALLTGHRSWVTRCCFSADERTVVSGGDDNTLRIWDIATSKQIRTVRMNGPVKHCVSLQDGRLLAIASRQPKIWDPQSGSHFALPMMRDFTAKDLAVSPDQRWAVIPGDEGLAVLDLTSFWEPPRILHHHGDLTCAVFDPRGKLVATGSEDGLIVLWDVARWRPVGQISAHLDEINQLAFSPDGAVLASAGEDKTVRLWNPALARPAPTTAAAAGVNVRGCTAAPDGAWLAVAKNAAIEIHDPVTTEVREVLNYSDRVFNMTPLASSFLAAELVSEVLICEVDNWQAARMLEHPEEATISDLTAGGDLVCVTDGSQVIVWNVATWKPPEYLEVGESGLRLRDTPAPTRASLGRRLMRWLSRLTSRLPRPPIGQYLVRRLNWRLARLARKPVSDLRPRISPDGDWLAVATQDIVHVASTRTWEPIAKLSLDSNVTGIIVVPQRRWLLVRCDRGFQTWNTETWLLEREIFDGHFVDSTKHGAWSPDGALLATVTKDRVLRVHDGGTGTCLTELRLDGELHEVVWLAPDRLVAVGAHGVYWFSYVPGSEPDMNSSVTTGQMEEQRQ